MADRPAPGSPPGSRIRTLLAAVEVIPARPDVPGYERDCGPGEGCVFGAAWTDATTAPLSHNGCDTRNDVLARTMTGVRFRPGTGRCVVVAGALDDPYTGDRIAFRKADAGEVQIDHVIPLAAAWDLGAHAWAPAMRRRFANDVDFELLAVDGPANMRKSDSTPQDWVPADAAYRCFYAAKYLTVAVRYSLPITAGDRDVLSGIAERCG
ncbi:HNH endonuclease family protein [Tomitella fengzijianii]|uniref:HNH endonuclease n=1 Tax=Tomitella fengzijianii TaxID=2597660 RepID=A0A516X7X0_9ACTN|nr:HNH endonuclease family protein [Tomitella fengzijianii]QDQ99158.1 HNH endonuclease [Tomitella fengzijianii]